MTRPRRPDYIAERIRAGMSAASARRLSRLIQGFARAFIAGRITEREMLAHADAATRAAMGCLPS